MKKVHEIYFPTIIEKFEEQTIEGTNVKVIKVAGTAVKEVVSRNGYKYVAKELEKATNSIIGRPILKDHKNLVDSIAGKVTKANYDVNDKSIKFEGQVFDERCKELIKAGFINHVSIGASIKGFKDEESAEGEKYKTVEGLEILELSLTPVPGVPMASVGAESQAIQISEAYGKYSEEEDGDEEENERIKKLIGDAINDVRIKQKIEEEVKMETKIDETLAVKEGFADLIASIDSGWAKETLMKFDIPALKELLAKIKLDVQKSLEAKKAEMPKPEAKGVVATEAPQVPKGPAVVTIPTGMRLGAMEAGTYVKELSGDGKASVWRVPDYKKYRVY